MKTLTLREVAHARSGEKGNASTISVIVYDPADYDLLREQVTVEAVRKVYGPITKGGIQRYEVPRIGALNFVLDEVLEGGRSRTLAFEESGKALSSLMLSVPMSVPDSYMGRAARLAAKAKPPASQATLLAGKTVRLGSATAWSRDRFEPASDLVARGNVDYLCFDSMSEVTMSSAQVSRMEDSNTPPYDPYLVARMEPILADCKRQGIRIVTNQGWLDPQAAAERVASLARELGIADLKVAAVGGAILSDRIRDMGLAFIEDGRPIAERGEAVISAEAYMHLPFGRHEGRDLEDLIVEAARGALAHSCIEGKDVDGIWLGNLNGGFTHDIFAASLVSQADPALRWKPATRVENACASGSAAIYAACDAIESGRAHIALVVGAEKMTAVASAETTRILGDCGYAKESDFYPAGFPGIFARLALDYFCRWGDQSVALARIAAKNHANGVLNPWAHMRKDLGFEFCNSVSERNPLIAPPLRKTDCSLVSDGAAALVLASDAAARDFSRAVALRARAQVNDYLPLASRRAGEFEGPRRAWATALEAARLTVHDLSFAEVHDCFTIAELLTYEAMGLAPVGQGERLISEGSVCRDGKLPINVSGGLKAKGHPIGATGVSMHAISAMQLCHEDQKNGDGANVLILISDTMNGPHPAFACQSAPDYIVATTIGNGLEIFNLAAMTF